MAAEKTVLIYGDSNTWGYDAETADRMPRVQRWPTILAQSLPTHVQVIAEGLNGRTAVFDDPVGPSNGTYSCNGRATMPAILHSHKPLHVVVLALGTNDLKRFLAASPEVIAKGVQILYHDIRSQLICENRTAGVKVVVCGVPRCFETQMSLSWDFVGCAERSAAVNRLLAEWAKTENVPFVDLGAAGEASKLDGIHYTRECQPQLAEAVAAALRPLL